MKNQGANTTSDPTQAIPRSRLRSIVTMVEVVSRISEGELTVPELAEALTKVFDGDTMMIYECGDYGLATPVIGDPLDEHSGRNARVSIVFDLYNSRYWDCPDATVLGRNVSDYKVLEDDGEVIAGKLWAFFHPKLTVDDDAAALGSSKPKNGAADCADYLNPEHPRYAPKLAAAVRAWQSVTEPNGKHPKQALTKWLREHAKEVGLVDDNGKPNETGIDEVAKVANWRPGGGAPKTPGK